MLRTYGLDFDLVQESYEEEIPETLQPWVEGKIREAFRLLAGLCPRTQYVSDTDVLRQGLVRDTVTRAVLRVVRDEDPALKSESENGYSYSKDSLVSSGNLWFPDADIRALGCEPGATRRGSKIGSARVRPGTPYAAPSRLTRGGGWW